jgi:hypothetical protein
LPLSQPTAIDVQATMAPSVLRLPACASPLTYPPTLLRHLLRVGTESCRILFSDKLSYPPPAGLDKTGTRLHTGGRPNAATAAVPGLEPPRARNRFDKSLSTPRVHTGGRPGRPRQTRKTRCASPAGLAGSLPQGHISGQAILSYSGARPSIGENLAARGFRLTLS